MGGESERRLGREDIEQFKEVRRHVKRMQAGTPLLIRSKTRGGAEDLEICECWVSQDLAHIKWREQEDKTALHELPIKLITDVDADPNITEDEQGDEDESKLSVTLTLRAQAKDDPVRLELICASPEDVVTWREGLRFLLGGQSPGAAPRAQAATSSSPAQSPTQSPKSQGMQERLRQQEEVIVKLRNENDLLQETLKRKDVIIAQLQQDLQNASAAGDRCSKTKSTSRESDEHLSYREAAILRGRNQKLKKALRAKQQTVSDLLQMLGKLTQQQGAESSAVDDDDEDDSAVVDSSRNRIAGAHAAEQLTSDGSSESETFKEEMRMLSGKGKKDVHKVDITSFKPPSRIGASAGQPPGRASAAPAGRADGLASAAAQQAVSPAASAASPAAAKQAPTAQAPMRFDFSAVRSASGGPGVGPGSAAALQTLAREMEILEEKKRVVERLAKRLDMPSDGEDDDGFPLQK